VLTGGVPVRDLPSLLAPLLAEAMRERSLGGWRSENPYYYSVLYILLYINTPLLPFLHIFHRGLSLHPKTSGEGTGVKEGKKCKKGSPV
jgi:hypothetical protein